MSPSADNADLSTDDRKHRRSKEEEEDESRRAKKKAGKGYSGQGDEYAVKGMKKMLQGSKKIRGKKGLLEKLVKDAPLEIFFEIFMHLEPGDLLQLARTSKDLRNVLMSKSSESIWRTARENIEPGLPRLPDDLSEPEYAHLLFFNTYCHKCLRKSTGKVSLSESFRTRCCNDCSLELYSMAEEMWDTINLDIRLKRVFFWAWDIDDDGEPFEVEHVGLVFYHKPSTLAAYQAEFDALQSKKKQDAFLERMKDMQAGVYMHLFGCICRDQYAARMHERSK